MKKLLQKKFLIPLIILLLLGGGAAIFKSRNDVEPQEPLKKVAGVSVEAVSVKSEVNIPIKVTGQIKGKQTTEIRALVDGTLLSVAPVGSQITLGAPLFRVSNQSVEAQYQSALSAYNNAQLSRAETEAVSDNSLRQAQLGVDQAEANVALAEQALRDAETTAELNLKIATDNAEIAYQQGYNTLETIIRYLGESTLERYAYENIIDASQTSLAAAEGQFFAAKNKFLNFSSTPSTDIIQSLLNLRSVFGGINDANNKTITLLNFAISGHGFTDADISAAKTQAAAFRTSLNALQSSIASTLNTIDNTKTQNLITTKSLRKKADIAELQLQNAETALASQKNSSALQKIGASGNVSSASSQLSLARRNFQNLQVPAPFAGTIISHKSNIGSQISPGQVILELGNLDAIEIKINLSASLSPGLRLGQSVKIDGLETGQISEIEAGADLSSGKMGVTIVADNQNGRFTQGGIADVEFDLVFETDEAVVIPLKLVKISQDAKSVLVIREGKVVEQPVQLGRLLGDQVEISQGLADGDTVIVKNGGFLSEGDPVEINK